MKKLRVWWIPQVPMKPFRVEVPDVATAKLLLITLADYDIFQFENNIKPDYCNVGGLEELGEDGEWCDWEHEEGGSIRDVMREEYEAKRVAESEADK